MSRYRTYGRGDEQGLVDGDTGFVGVDERDPSQVKPGFCSYAVNKLFKNGVAEDRLGVEALPWMNDATSQSYLTPLASDVLAGAVFNDPDDTEWIIVATPTAVFAVREGAAPVAVSLPDSVTLTECSFTQAMNKLIMFRGVAHPVLEMSSVASGFAAVAQVANADNGVGTNNPSDGTETIPQATSGIWMQNRLFVPHSRDLVAASDYLNYTRYSATRSDMRINQGSADALVALYKFGDAGLIAFKEQTIYQVQNVHGDLSLIRLEEITREFGLVARKAVASDGADPWFLSQRGVTSIGQILDNKARTEKQTWSDPMTETMKRINWQYASRATATYYDGMFLLAVPLDDALVTNNAGTFTGVNNAILVFDNQNQAWAGIWQGASIMVKDWIQFTWAGKRRLGFLSDDGMLMMLNHAFDDWVRPSTTAGGGLTWDTEAGAPEFDTEAAAVVMDTEAAGGGGVGSSRAEILSVFRTRGYTFAPNDSSPEERRAASTTVKRYAWATVGLKTWNPRYELEAVVDGANEVEVIEAIGTRDRTRWVYPFSRQRWVESNVNGDHGDPGREDYSVQMDDTAGGVAINLDASDGVNLELHQEALVRRKVNAKGRYVQVEVSGSRGRCAVMSVGVEGRTATRRGGILV